jgi:hypothetical protein
MSSKYNQLRSSLRCSTNVKILETKQLVFEVNKCTNRVGNKWKTARRSENSPDVRGAGSISFACIQAPGEPAPVSSFRRGSFQEPKRE